MDDFTDTTQSTMDPIGGKPTVNRSHSKWYCSVEPQGSCGTIPNFAQGDPNGIYLCSKHARHKEHLTKYAEERGDLHENKTVPSWITDTLEATKDPIHGGYSKNLQEHLVKTFPPKICLGHTTGRRIGDTKGRRKQGAPDDHQWTKCARELSRGQNTKELPLCSDCLKSQSAVTKLLKETSGTEYTFLRSAMSSYLHLAKKMREDARKTKPEMKEKQEMMESGYQPYSNTFSSVQSSDRSVRVPDWRTFLPEAKKIFEIQKYDYLAVNEGEIGQLLSQASYLTNSFKSPYIGSHNDSNSISSTERGNLTNAQYQAPHLEPSFSGANLTNDPRCQGQENSLFGQNQAVYSNQASFPNQAFDPDQAFYSSQAFNPDTADTPMVNVHNFRQHVPAQRYDMPNAPGTVNYAIGDLTGLTDKEFKDLVDAQTSQQNH